jgi:hypothetical protein
VSLPAYFASTSPATRLPVSATSANTVATASTTSTRPAHISGKCTTSPTPHRRADPSLFVKNIAPLTTTNTSATGRGDTSNDPGEHIHEPARVAPTSYVETPREDAEPTTDASPPSAAKQLFSRDDHRLFIRARYVFVLVHDPNLVYALLDVPSPGPASWQDHEVTRPEGKLAPVGGLHGPASGENVEPLRARPRLGAEPAPLGAPPRAAGRLSALNALHERPARVRGRPDVGVRARALHSLLLVREVRGGHRGEVRGRRGRRRRGGRGGGGGRRGRGAWPSRKRTRASMWGYPRRVCEPGVGWGRAAWSATVS